MKWLAILLCSLSVPLSAQNLKTYQWKNRVILLFAASADALVEKQNMLFAEERAAMAERDLIILQGEQAILKDLSLPDDFQGVVLIGKDGRLKFSGSFLVEPETLFTLIDGMPMRKAEIRKGKRKSGQ